MRFESQSGSSSGGAPANICVICKEDIKTGALKCVKCQSYQHPWPRRFSLLTPILSSFVSLPVAIIAIATALFSLGRFEFTPAESNVDYSFQNADFEFIIRGYNSGIRPGLFARALPTISTNDKTEIELREKTDQVISIDANNLISLAPPNNLALTGTRPQWSDFDAVIRGGSCQIEFFGTKFSGLDDHVGPKQLDCEKISCWLYRQKYSSQQGSQQGSRLLCSD